MTRQRVFEHVHRAVLKIASWVKPPETPAPVLVGFDSFEPGCEQHAYCGALERVIDGHHVVLIPAVDDEGARCIHTFAGTPNDGSAGFALSEDARVRGVHAAVSIHGFRLDLQRRGILQ